MNKIFLYGAGKNGKIVKDLIESRYATAYCISAFIDSYKSGKYCGLPIKKIADLKKEDVIVITLANLDLASELYLSLINQGFSCVYWFRNFLPREVKNDDFLQEYCLNKDMLGDCILPHMELHIADKCNLNCKGCTHFAPLFDEIGSNFDRIIDDVKKVAKIFSHVMVLDILGGEPLLNPDLSRYIIEIRKLLPNTSIDVFTNGLLIPRLPKETFQCMRENHIYVTVTEYKPTHAMINQIVSCLEDHAVEYLIVPYDSRQKFNRPISISDQSRYPQMCISNGCVTVARGMIARCPTLMYIGQFNKYFNQTLPTEGIMSLDSGMSGYEFLAKLKEDVPLCRHCIKCDMRWEVCGREIKLEDFAVED